MTGDTTPISDEARARVSAWLDDDEALRIPDTEWGRQLYADVRGLCAVPLLVSAEAERLRDELTDATRQRDSWRQDALFAEDRIDALSEKLRDRDAVVEGLRAELAKLEAAITKLRATHADALADRDAITRVIMRERDEARARPAPSTTDPNDERAAMIWGIVSRLTPVESDAQDACDEIEALIAPMVALRAAGGQEKPNRCEWCAHAAHFPAACTRDAAPLHPGYECNCCGEWDSRPDVLAALAAAPVGGQEQEKPNDATNWHNWDCNRTNCPGCYDGPRP